MTVLELIIGWAVVPLLPVGPGCSGNPCSVLDLFPTVSVFVRREKLGDFLRADARFIAAAFFFADGVFTTSTWCTLVPNKSARSSAPATPSPQKDPIIPSVFESNYKKQTFRYQNCDSDMCPKRTPVAWIFSVQAVTKIIESLEDVVMVKIFSQSVGNAMANCYFSF